MKRLLAYLKPHKWTMAAATLLVLFIIVVELYRPIIIGDAIDDYINGYYHPMRSPLRTRRAPFPTRISGSQKRRRGVLPDRETLRPGISCSCIRTPIIWRKAFPGNSAASWKGRIIQYWKPT